MPSIDISKLSELKDDIKKYKTFVETGTYEGETTSNLFGYFDKVITIEIDEQLFREAKLKFSLAPNVHCIKGDSSVVFKTILPNIHDDTIFFLDGHYSGGKTGRGETDVPLEQELTLINNLFKHKGIILIDDYRLFQSQEKDWTLLTKNKMIELLGSRVQKVYTLPSSLHPEDVLVLHISKL
jgi:hypothetical protein